MLSAAGGHVRSRRMREKIAPVIGAVCLGAAGGLIAIYASSLFDEAHSGTAMVAIYAVASAAVTMGCLAAFLRKGG